MVAPIILDRSFHFRGSEGGDERLSQLEAAGLNAAQRQPSTARPETAKKGPGPRHIGGESLLVETSWRSKTKECKDKRE